MKKILTIIAIIILSMVSTAQAEESKAYINLNLGVNNLRDATLSDETASVEVALDNGLAMSAALGRKFTAARAELEFAWRKNNIESFSAFGTTLKGGGDISSKSMMVNFLHDFSGADNIVPFVGAGLGLARIDINNATVAGIPLDDADDTVFAWQLMAGIGFAVAEDTFIDISWRYNNAVSPEFEGTDAEYKAHSLMAGIRVGF